MTRIDPSLDTFQILLVTDDLIKKGYQDWNLSPGNDCVWASIRGKGCWLDFYYIFRDGKICDIQID
jgi:hypothetical protein